MDLVLVIRGIFSAVEWLIFARIILSFLTMFTRIDPYNPIVKFVHDATEPLMGPFRRLIPPLGGMDFSPIILFMVLNLLEKVLIDIVLGF
ncbi:YggT family protein [bacterium]|nr:MAG: YggT family protein [bacterium]